MISFECKFVSFDSSCSKPCSDCLFFKKCKFCIHSSECSNRYTYKSCQSDDPIFKSLIFQEKFIDFIDD